MRCSLWRECRKSTRIRQLGGGTANHTVGLPPDRAVCVNNPVRLGGPRPSTGDRMGAEAARGFSSPRWLRRIRHARSVRAPRFPPIGKPLPAGLSRPTPTPENARPAVHDSREHLKAMRRGSIFSIRSSPCLTVRRRRDGRKEGRPAAIRSEVR